MTAATKGAMLLGSVLAVRLAFCAWVCIGYRPAGNRSLADIHHEIQQ
ncbi:MAG: hypothetical protein V1929_00320 [bacterium]